MELKVDFYENNIDSVYDRLLTVANDVNRSLRVKCEPSEDIILTYDFNGHLLKSSDTLDECYVKVTGHTKADHEKKMREYVDDLNKKEEEWQKTVPDYVQAECDRARGIIREDKYDLWDEIVPIRLRDLYHGMELGATLEILTEWNKEHSAAACRKVIESQGHSGMSHRLVCSMVRSFAKGTDEEVKNLFDVLYN